MLIRPLTTSELDVSVVNAPVPGVVSPMFTLSTLDNVPGLIVTVPLGLKLALVLTVNAPIVTNPLELIPNAVAGTLAPVLNVIVLALTV